MSDIESDQIERSAGELVTAGGMPARVGGGYRGKRDDQDEAVKEFARRLAATFPNHEIQIRYNTNRMGGGAWLKDGKRNTQVGLGADLIAPEWQKRAFEKYVWGGGEKPTSATNLDPDELRLRYTVNCKQPVVDERQCNRNTDRDDRESYVYKTFLSLEAAWGYFMSLDHDEVNPPADD